VAPGQADVLGVDGCRGGWVGALWLAGWAEPVVLAAPDFGTLVREATRAVRGTRGIRVVAVDIPIGLPDTGAREADRLARRALPGRASSVFPTLARRAYEAEDYACARAVSVALTGTSASAQAYALGRKVLEVDAWVRAHPDTRVIEVHPEVCFAAMNGQTPLPARKKTLLGLAVRRDLLAAEGMEVPDLPASLRGVGHDDLVDACAAAWTARRAAAGLARPLPDPPQFFSDGIPAAIWC
jgi:predicted RNase H-like nuclease